MTENRKPRQIGIERFFKFQQQVPQQPVALVKKQTKILQRGVRMKFHSRRKPLKRKLMFPATSLINPIVHFLSPKYSLGSNSVRVRHVARIENGGGEIFSGGAVQ